MRRLLALSSFDHAHPQMHKFEQPREFFLGEHDLHAPNPSVRTRRARREFLRPPRAKTAPLCLGPPPAMRAAHANNKKVAASFMTETARLACPSHHAAYG
jgi:hypothetical protein